MQTERKLTAIVRESVVVLRTCRLASLARLGLLPLAIGASGCAVTPNQYKEDGPATAQTWETPTESDLRTRFEPSDQRVREWTPIVIAPESGAVQHLPLYFEDPFVDKGAGRNDENSPQNVYRLGWEDWVALPYGYGRNILNLVALPVSAVVTPPWTIMQSDGVISRQLLGYDHDAIPLSQTSMPPAAAYTSVHAPQRDLSEQPLEERDGARPPAPPPATQP